MCRTLQERGRRDATGGSQKRTLLWARLILNKSHRCGDDRSVTNRRYRLFDLSDLIPGSKRSIGQGSGKPPYQSGSKTADRILSRGIYPALIPKSPARTNKKTYASKDKHLGAWKRSYIVVRSRFRIHRTAKVS